ncbi:MAG: hypothetical protein H6920_07075 [Sphingomonadaceae bacterium]|jgi:hypothetical protein|nr:hypothetical protein [Sphingomonadaceae bacterium]MCP5384268.1 hypothetical protein [Altererythrobacter sp.]MCP5391366.1 hypothetical protein [Sphingomonadaceae bacterium]MCP5393595.1 hypothetical protein [Sphingomonadaceae bacterium]
MSDDPAKARFFLISLNRLFGAVMVIAGILGATGTIPVDDWFAYALMAVGAVEFFVVPQILSRAWRSPKP